MGKHHKKRKHMAKPPGAMTVVPKTGCPFYCGQRLFDYRSGFFVGIVLQMEWCDKNKEFYATTDTNVWYWSSDLESEVSIGQRKVGEPQYGPISHDAYGYYDEGIIEDITNCPPRPGEAYKPKARRIDMDTDEQAFKDYQNALAYGEYGHS